MKTEKVSVTSFLPADWCAKNHFHVLRIGHCPLDAHHLREGDDLIVEMQDAPRKGEPVLLRISDTEPVIGRISPDGHEISFESPRHPGRGAAVQAQEVRVSGILVGILRKHSAAESPNQGPAAKQALQPR
ncbi:MAG: hypothetical protein AB1646_18015 [Thermodesulfobacteriota bacterium]